MLTIYFEAAHRWRFTNGNDSVWWWINDDDDEKDSSGIWDLTSCSSILPSIVWDVDSILLNIEFINVKINEFLLFIDFCLSIATRLRVVGSSVEYLWTILGNDACLRDWCLYIDEVDLVINEQYGQPYRFGSINEFDDDDWVLLLLFVVVSLIFCIYCDIDPLKRNNKNSFIRIFSFTSNNIWMFTFNMCNTITSVFIPLNNRE